MTESGGQWLESTLAIGYLKLYLSRSSTMKNTDVKVGMEVVVNKLTDTQIYKVSRLEGFVVGLTYMSEKGILCNGGDMDTSVLMKPSRAQLDYRHRTIG